MYLCDNSQKYNSSYYLGTFLGLMLSHTSQDTPTNTIIVDPWSLTAHPCPLLFMAVPVTKVTILISNSVPHFKYSCHVCLKIIMGNKLE